MTNDVSVRVALRIRPMLPHESSIGCQSCISEVPGEPQVVAGSKEFTYDYVFGSNTGQSPIFDNCVLPLLDKFFSGYNCTILAYGQTGAGKTHTMGTADISPSSDHSNTGVIPRIIHDLFSRIAENDTTTYKLKSTYLEIYNEEVKDLLTGSVCQNAIRENHDGSIVIAGLKEAVILSVEDLYGCLRIGAGNRAVAGHALNASSSRSHAVFSIILEQQKQDSDSYLISKFNLVDLAGSERAKRTKAEGDRLKEGININKGLLALGNVISALGDPDRKTGYVPYRDSKITRLLQDSLGGNSLTLMVACCSPADSNLEETINTLRYADRARKIKNKAVVNRDPKVAELLALRKENAELKANLLANGGGVDLTELNRLRQENDTLKEEKESLIIQLRGTDQSTTNKLTRLAELLTVTQIERDKLRDKLVELTESGVIQGDILGDDSVLNDTTDSTTESIDAEDAIVADNKRKEIGEKLQMLSEKLNSHEAYAKSLQQNDDTFAMLREQYQNNINNLNKELTDLNTEKASLEKKICELEKGPGNKEQIKQKNQVLAGLQKQISELQNKCKENEKLLKIKKGSDEQLVKLSKEIAEMKRSRVTLLKDLRSETKKFQQFKQAKNKEIVQLKRFEEKKRADLYKQAAAQQRSANVMKRRYEEAQNANKRLKEQMDKQQKAMAKRVGPGKSVDVKGLLKGHVELKMSKTLAKDAVEMFIEQRKKLHDALQALKRLPKHMQNDNVKKDIEEVEKKIQLKSAQISSIQTQIIKLDQNDAKNDIFRQFTSISDCKTGLKWLTSAMVDCQMKEKNLQSQIEDDEVARGKLQDEIAAMELNIEDIKRHGEATELQLRKEFEDTISVLRVQNNRLKSLRSNQPASIKAREMKRRQLMRSLSISGISTSESETESTAGPDDSWLEENKDLVHELENVGLKTPGSVKKALRRRTTRARDTHKCSCKGACSTKICGCKGFGKQCDSRCTCKIGHCLNRDSDLEISINVPKNLFDNSGSSDHGDELYDDFKENRLGNVKTRDIESSPLKRPTKTLRRKGKHPKINS